MISIILPVYNGMPYLKDAIESIINQTYKNWELLIIDDGSTDNSVNYIKSICIDDKRIRLMQHERNKGIATTYNTGIRHCKGQFIAFQEQDDISLENRLEAQVSIIMDKKAPFVTSRVGWIDANNQVYKYWPNNINNDIEILPPSYNLYCKLLINQTFFPNASTMLDRNGIDADDLIFDEVFKTSGQDWDLHLRLVRKYTTIRISNPLVLMRRFPEMISSTSNKINIFRDNRQLLKKHWYFNYKATSKRDISTFLKAWSNEFLIEGRYCKGLYGIVLGIFSMILWPLNSKAWFSFLNLLKKISVKR